jgi:hypothetical protein
MVNLKLLSRFIARMLLIVLPLLGLVLVCSLTTALLTEEIQALDRLGTWQFWAAVSLGVGMAAGALVSTYFLAARWVQALYGLPNLKEGRGFVERQLFGLRGFAPWFRVEGGALSEPETHILRKVGGPGNLVISLDSAVLTERAGMFSRVLDAGNQNLDEFERVYTALDLRPRRQVVSVSGMSYEGIPVTCDLEVRFSLTPRPVDKKAQEEWKQILFKAATASWMREAHHGDERMLDWAERLVGAGMGALRGQLALYRLDELVGLTGVQDPAGGNEPIDARPLIQEVVEQAIRDAAPKLGVDVSEGKLQVDLGDIRVTDAVTQQWVDLCKAQWTRRAAEHQILGKAQHVNLVEAARNDAAIKLLIRAVGALQSLTDDERQITSKLVLSRLFMVLPSEPSGDSLTRVYLPREAVNTLNEVKKLLL